MDDKRKKLLKIEDELFRNPRTQRIVQRSTAQDDDMAGYAEKYAETIDFFGEEPITDDEKAIYE